jgi:DNA-directed RNA polymerase specialized sigma24 family protein
MMEDPAERAARLLLVGGSLTASDYAALRSRIVAYLRTMDVMPVEAEDIADETVAQVMRTRKATHDVRNPVGYILRSAHNERINRLRRRREEPIGPDFTIERSGETNDDELLRLLDRNLDLQTIRAALALANRNDDVTCLLVVQTWLDLAADHETTPSSRDVGRELGIAHSTVQRVLRRFREYVEIVRKESFG